MNKKLRNILCLVALSSLVMLTATLTSLNIGREIATQYTPLVHAAIEIKLEATTAHLWLEESISGDSTIDIERVWNHIDQSAWYAQAMLNGGSNSKVNLTPLNDAKLRTNIEETIRNIDDFHDIARQRWKTKTESKVGSDLDQRFDKVFASLILSADSTATTLQEAIVEDVYYLKVVDMLLIMIIVIFALIVGILFYRYDCKQKKIMLKLRDREEDLRITLHAIGEAVIVTDVHGNISYMNPVAIKLTGWTLESALSKPLPAVFHIIDAHTKKPVPNPVEKVLKTNAVVGLKGHSLLIAKDESEYQITHSGAPILTYKGVLNGVVLVFRDISQEYSLHATIQKNEERLNLAMEGTKAGVWDWNMETGKIFFSKELRSLWGYNGEDISYDLSEWLSRVHPEDLALVEQALNQYINGNISDYEAEHRALCKDGTYKWGLARGKITQWSNDNKPLQMIGTYIDLSERKKTEMTLIESEARLQEAQQYAQIGHWELLKDSTIATWSKQMYTIFGLPLNTESSPETLVEILHASDCKGFMESLQHSFTSGEEHYIEYRITRPNDGEERWIECRGQPVLNSCGEVEKISGFIQDITERKQTQGELQLSARVFKETKDGITITNTQNQIVDVNPAFCEITGYSREEILGQNPSILSSGKQNAQFYIDMWVNLNKYGHWQGEVWNRTKSGELYAELLSISSLLDNNGNVVNYVGVFSDITHIKHQQEELNKMAHYDVLTQLPNRTILLDRFQQAAAHCKRSEHQLAVCFLDLDKFKPINDNYGHKVGDLLLKEVADRIKETIREEDTVSRQGGDEFALLLCQIESFSHCEKLLDRLLKVIAQPYIIDDVSHTISASCGITLYPLDDADLDTLLRHADHAMYQAKQAGRNRHCLFNVENEAFFSQQQQKCHEVSQALDNNELVLYYQPKVHMPTGDVYGMEALIRWLHPEKGLIPPLDFLPAIEGSEVELKLGNWVVNQALAQLDAWRIEGINLEISINISSHHLRYKLFYYQLAEAFVKYPLVDPKLLQLEILESSALGDLTTISNIIKTCQEKLGLTIALDDFGTGFSSLTHLRNLSVDTVKIDQTFVRDVLDDASDYAIIDGVIGLANAFNSGIIAEGVETIEHGLVLLIMGCDYAQGYGIAKPMPVDNITEWLRQYTPNKTWKLFASKERSVKEKKLKLLQLITINWFNRFTKNVTSSPQNVTQWPNMIHKSDHCGQWIKREKQDSIFNKECLCKLDIAHVNFHLIAKDLLLDYQNGEIDKAREGLVKLQSSFDIMSNVLVTCE